MADPRDGELDVAVLPAGSRLALARRAWGLRRGTIEQQEPVEHHRGAVIEVRAAAPAPSSTSTARSARAGSSA